MSTHSELPCSSPVSSFGLGERISITSQRLKSPLSTAAIQLGLVSAGISLTPSHQELVWCSVSLSPFCFIDPLSVSLSYVVRPDICMTHLPLLTSGEPS